MSNLSDFSSCNNMTINNNLVVGQDTTLQNLTCNGITSDTVYVENLILQSQDVNAKLLTIDDDVKVLEASVNDLSATKATITYVDTQIANLIGGATESYDTLVEIQTLLQEDDTQIDSLFTAVGLRALDANTVHKDSNEIVTGSKQFDGNIILNSNMKANNIDITPVEVSRLHNVVSDIQPQINTLTTGVANLQPQQTSISATTILNDNYRNNGWFVITASTAINITLPNPTNNIGKVFWFTNQSPSACNIIGNGSNQIKYESNVGAWSSVASISITPNATLSVCFKSGGYVVLYNSYVVLQLNTSTNTSVSATNTNVSALQTKAQMISYDSGDGSTVISRSSSTNRPTLRIIDDTGKTMYFLPNATDNAYNYLTEANDSVIAYSNALSIVPYINSTNGIRMKQSVVKIGSTSSQPQYGLDNAVIFDGTARTITLNSPNWVSCNNAFACPDVILNSTSLAQTLTGLNTKTQMITYEPNSTVITKSINGASSVPTLSLYDINSANLFYFCPNVNGGSYNLMPHDHDALLIARYNFTIGPWTAKNVGIRMTDSDLQIGASTVAPLDNKIVMNADAKTISFVTPNWIASNQSFIAPDFYLSATQESISDIIGVLRTTDTTLLSQISAARQETYQLSEHVDANQASTNTAIASTNTSIANLTKIWAYARVFLNGSSVSATYTLLGYNNNITSVTRIATGACGIVITSGSSSHWCATASSGQTSTRVMTGTRAGFPQFHWVILMSGDDDFSFTLI
jgi:hypothetical protein